MHQFSLISRSVTEIAGAAGTGKTQISMQYMINVIKMPLFRSLATFIQRRR
jgi:RecA/RadA recombinase